MSEIKQRGVFVIDPSTTHLDPDEIRRIDERDEKLAKVTRERFNLIDDATIFTAADLSLTINARG